MKHVIDAIDWTSIKVSMAPLFMLFIGDGFMKAMGFIALSTTIIYNSIRIYKELKKPKNQ